MNEGSKRYSYGDGRFFDGLSRSQKRANQRLGVIHGSHGDRYSPSYRSPMLLDVDKYLDGRQYDGKIDWDEGASGNDFTSIFKRKPKIIFPFAKVFRNRVGGKLLGPSSFPKIAIEEDKETEYFLNAIFMPKTNFKVKLLGVAKSLVLRNSAFIRFYYKEGAMLLEEFNSNYCYPKFDDKKELEEIVIKYVYDTGEKENKSDEETIKRWYKLKLTKDSDIMFDNPKWKKDEHEPEFKVKEKVDHELGFVQGQWFRMGDGGIDGDETPIISDIKSFIDCLNYNMSLAAQAINYGLEPQLVLSGMVETEVDELIKSSSKGWVLGQQGQAQFVEVSGSGVASAMEFRTDSMKYFQWISRMVLLDPEKMVGSAQSGRAMEVLHAPMVEFIQEIRPYAEEGIKLLLEKMMATTILLNRSLVPLDIFIPNGWEPKSLDMSFIWPPIFELTTQDKSQIVSLATQISSGNIASRDTMLRWIQAQGVDIGIEDYELEEQKVNNQKEFNSFAF